MTGGFAILPPMAITRTYQPTDLALNTELTLDKPASQHLLKVMRLRINDSLIVFNGKGGEYQATLTAIDKQHAIVHLDQFIDISRESPISIHLGQGLSRGERMDYAIQKSVELGVAEITPLLTERCNAKLPADRIQKRLDHWHKTIISACEQSGRTQIPQIHPPAQLADWVKAREGLNLVCDLEGRPFQPAPSQNQVNLLIGPEGGLTPEELDLAKQHQFNGLQLGPRTLRTETATVAALTIIQQVTWA